MRRYTNGGLRLRTVEILQTIAFLTNHKGAEDTKEEESDRTVEILQTIALFNEPQRRRGHRGRRERSHGEDFAGGRLFERTWRV